MLQIHIMAMLRPGQECARAAMPITFACSVGNAGVRAVIRRRVRAGEGAPTPLTAKQRQTYLPFAAASEGERPLPLPLPDAGQGGARTLEASEKALLWRLLISFLPYLSSGTLNRWKRLEAPMQKLSTPMKWERSSHLVKIRITAGRRRKLGGRGSRTLCGR